IRPASGRMVPARRCRSVVLPEPLGPISPRISPGETASDMPLTAINPPNALRNPSVSRSAAMASALLRDARRDLVPTVLDRAGDSAGQRDWAGQPGPRIEQRPRQPTRQFERPPESGPPVLEKAG